MSELPKIKIDLKGIREHVKTGMGNFSLSDRARLGAVLGRQGAEDSFIYEQAIKEHFTMPCSLPDEDVTREMEFHEILIKIAWYDI